MNITKLGCRGSKTTHRKLDDESILSLLTAGNTQTLIEKVREKLQSAIPDKSGKFSYISKFHIIISCKLIVYIVMCFYQETN